MYFLVYRKYIVIIIIAVTGLCSKNITTSVAERLHCRLPRVPGSILEEIFVWLTFTSSMSLNKSVYRDIYV